MNRMKGILSVLILALAGIVFAVDLTVSPGGGWSDNNGESQVDYSGKGWPLLVLKTPALEKDAFYKLSWNGKCTGDSVKTFFGYKDKEKGSSKHFNMSWIPAAEYNHYTFYFKNRVENPYMYFSMAPGQSGKVSIKNINLTKLEDKDLKSNLLNDGNFETNSSPIAFYREGGKGLKGNSIEDSPAFLSGTKSLRMNAEQESTNAILSHRMPVRPGKTVELKFWAKSEVKPIALRTVINFYGIVTKGGKHLYTAKTLRIDKEWKQYTITFNVPNDLAKYPALKDGSAFLQFHLGKDKDKAAVWLDNIEFYEK